MTMWILKAKVAPGQDYIAMPETLPLDISACHTEVELKQKLREMFPDSAPETIAARAERTERFLGQMILDDIVVVVDGDELKCCDIAGLPYAEEIDGVFEHRIPVAWFEKDTPMRLFKHFPNVVNQADRWPTEITNLQARAAIQGKLPLPGNRFAKWKWLLAAAFIMQAIAMLAGMFR